MKIIIINGSPRKNGNTAALCREFLKGVESTENNIETEIINLYDLNYTGCKSCFACKRIEGDTYGKCVIRDDLQGILTKVLNADGIVLGSPIYFGEMTGQLKTFLERFIFPVHTYEEGYKSIAPKRMPITMIYTMNVTEELMDMLEYRKGLSNMEGVIEHIFTKPEIIYAFNTYQFNDYSKYRVETFSEPEKAKYRADMFPVHCKKAFESGKSMAEKIMNRI